MAKLSTPSRAPRSSKLQLHARRGCVSTPPVMLRANLVTVIPSLDWVGVTPHRAGRRTGQRRACTGRLLLGHSVRPAGVEWVTGPGRRIVRRTVRKDVSRIVGVRPGLGTHPHADQSVHQSGGSLSAQLNPRCRDGLPPYGTLGAPLGLQWRGCYGTPIQAEIAESRGMVLLDIMDGWQRPAPI